MPERIKIEPGLEKKVPSVSVAPVKVKPSFISEIAKGVTEGFSNYATAKAREDELFAKQQAAEELNNSLRNVMGGMNEYIDITFQKIGPDYLPDRAKTDIMRTSLKRLAESKIPVDKWNIVTSQMDRLVDDIGKPHFFSLEGGRQMAIFADGTTQELFAPGANKTEETLIDYIAEIPDVFTRQYFVDLNTKDPEAAKNLMISIGRAQIKIKYNNAETSDIDLISKRIALNEKQKELIYPKNKIELFTEFNNVFDELKTSIAKSLQVPGMNPESAYSGFETYIQDWANRNLIKLEKAGYKDPKDFFTSIKPYLDATKRQFETRSKFGDDKFKVAESDLKMKMAEAAWMGEMSQNELALWNQPAKFAQLMTGFFYLRSVAENDIFRQKFPNISALAMSVGRGQNDLERDKEFYIPGDIKRFNTLVNSLGKKARILDKPDSSESELLSVNRIHFEWLSETVIDDPLWESFKQTKPKVAIAIEEMVTRINRKAEVAR